MKKRKRILLAALLVVVLGGLVLLAMPSGPPDPVYDGHPVSWWVRQDPIDIATNLPTMDRNAVPYLVAALRTRDVPLRGPYMGVRKMMPAVVQGRLPVPVEACFVRMLAAYYLHELGRDAEPAIPELLRVLNEDKDPDVRRMAATALGRIGKNDKIVSKALVESLKDDDPYVRSAAGTALKQLDPEAASKAGVK